MTLGLGLAVEILTGNAPAAPAALGWQAPAVPSADASPQAAQGWQAPAVRSADASPQTALRGYSVLVVGAGAMSSLAVATATRQGADSVFVANRTRGNAERLAEKYGAKAIGLADLETAAVSADLVVTCTGATEHVVTAATVQRALARRAGTEPGDQGGPRELVFLDLALPRDVEPEVADLPGVRLIDMTAIAAAGQPGEAASPQAVALASDADVVAVRRIVAQELSSFSKADRAASVVPTVVALRAKAATVVETELARLDRRLGDLDQKTRREIAQSMSRVADKLLHGPTVRVKELADSPGADSYETALRVLFELDPDTVQSVGRPDVDMLAWPATQEGDT